LAEEEFIGLIDWGVKVSARAKVMMNVVGACCVIAKVVIYDRRGYW
jgi:hypothetical protein